jgi:hypothetical protein
MTEFTCRVGGRAFLTSLEVLTKVEGSFFHTALSKDWNSQSSAVLEIARNGTHFQYVLDYLRYGYIPRDAAGRCDIPHEALKELRVEADYYGLPMLVQEVDRLLKFSVKGMRYFISSFYLNSGRCNGGLSFEEYATYEEALTVYNKAKKDNTDPPPSYVDQVFYNETVSHENSGQNVVVEETADEKTGKVNFAVFEDGSWKRPSGTQLLCIPITDSVGDDGSLYTCAVRTFPDNRTYY